VLQGSIFYLFAEALPVVYNESYGFSMRHSSLVFLILATGTLLSLLPRLYDVHVTKVRARQNRSAEPEDKLFGFLVAAPLLAVSLWCFAGSVPPYVNISPAVSMIPLLPIGFVVVEFDYVLSGYLTDIYATRAASATAAMCFLRALLSGVFPLFGRQMFEGLGANNATFILAGLATLFCSVAEVFRRHGKDIRHRSRVAEETCEEPATV
jgi:hypothetical protein